MNDLIIVVKLKEIQADNRNTFNFVFILFNNKWVTISHK